MGSTLKEPGSIGDFKSTECLAVNEDAKQEPTPLSNHTTSVERAITINGKHAPNGNGTLGLQDLVEMSSQADSKQDPTTTPECTISTLIFPSVSYGSNSGSILQAPLYPSLCATKHRKTKPGLPQQCTQSSIVSERIQTEMAF